MPAKPGPDDLPPLVEVPADPKSKTPQARERYAVVLPLTGGGNLANSAELKQFLAARQALRPGTVQIVILIHEAA